MDENEQTQAKAGGGEEEVTEDSKKVAADKVSPNCAEEFKKLKIRRKYRYIIFKIEVDTVVVEKTRDKDATTATLKADLPPTECRYCVYDHEYATADGRRPSKLFFLCWMPHASPPWLKMAYTHGKSVLRDQVDGVFDCLASGPEEVEDAFGIEGADEDEDSDISDL